MDYAYSFEEIVKSYWGNFPKTQIYFATYYDTANGTFDNAYELKSMLLSFCIYEINYEDNTDEEKITLDKFINDFQTIKSPEIQDFISFLYKKRCS